MNRAFLQATHSLYLIATQGKWTRKEYFSHLRGAIEGGVDLVQMREKEVNSQAALALGQELSDLCRELGVPLIVNDDARLARAIGADGLHLGQDDLSSIEARDIVGADMVLGLSTHNLTQVANAMADDAVDMLGFGPVFHTTTKDAGAAVGCPGLAEIQSQSWPKPIWAIGGINTRNLESLVEARCRHIAVSSAIMSSDDARAASSALKRILIQP